MIKKVRIHYFNNKSQDRLKFVKLLAENNPQIGLKKAKNLQDQMLEGVPFDYEVVNEKLDNFIKELDELNIKHEIIEDL